MTQSNRLRLVAVAVSATIATACVPETEDESARRAQLDCTEVSLNSISYDSIFFAGRPICTEGIVRFHNDQIFLVAAPSDQAAPGRQVYLLDTHPVVGAGDIRTGDRVAVAGAAVIRLNCFDVDNRGSDREETPLVEYCPDPPEPVFIEVGHIEVLNRDADHSRVRGGADLNTLH